jgi:hypothetical protein
MSVYVDAAAQPFGRMIMCHLMADTPEELRAMALRIGVAVKWFQYKASAPHFDICKSKRALAVAAGALELEREPFVEAMRRIRASWPRDGKGRWLLPTS